MYIRAEIVCLDQSYFVFQIDQVYTWFCFELLGKFAVRKLAAVSWNPAIAQSEEQMRVNANVLLR